jgi:hypothetical protein
MTYHEHLTSTAAGPPSNYVISCTCGWSTRLAARDDMAPAKVALAHVEALQPPADPFAGL